MKPILQDFQLLDLDRCIEIRVKNWKEINNTPEKIDWAKNRFLSTLPQRTYFVAKIWEEIVGLGGYGKNQLYSFFIDPEHHGQWIWKLLMQRILSEIINAWYKDAVVSASEYGKSFYEHFWFNQEEKEWVKYFLRKIF